MIYSHFKTKKNRSLQIRLFILWNTLVPVSTVFACGGVLDIECNLKNGGLSPGNIIKQGGIIVNQGARTVQDASQAVANAINELQASVLSGPILEQAIVASRSTAINGSRPIPTHIRRQLTGYASEDSMNRVRYKIGDNGFANLARLLEQGGLARAVTLVDVIVFRDQSDADDPSLWAHELIHVDQYRDGVRSFSVRYARNWQSIENPAYEKGGGYFAWAQQNQRIQAPGLQLGQSGFPPGFGMLVCGCYGPGPIYAPEPRCMSGAVRMNLCPGLCIGGVSPYAYVCR